MSTAPPLGWGCLADLHADLVAMTAALAQLHTDLVALTAATTALNTSLIGGINVHIL